MSQALESGYSVLENMAGFSSADFPGKNLQGMHRSDAVISVVLVSGLPICPNLQHIQKCWWNCIRWFTLCGTCHDVTWLCEFLACQLFGNGEISSKISAIDPRNQKWITVLHSSELCTYIYICNWTLPLLKHWGWTTYPTYGSWGETPTKLQEKSSWLPIVS